MSIVAIITARSGSKRIPRKNIKNFLGKPILAYPIEAALESSIFDEIMVSTDDSQIAGIAKNLGAKVPFMRSAKTSNDFATTFDVIDEVLTEYSVCGKNFDELCCIYPCSPFLTSEMLLEAYEKMQNYDAVMPVCKYPVPIEWAMKIEDELLHPNDRDAQNLRSQDISPKYYDAGMFYFCKVNKLYEYRSLSPEKTAPYIIPEIKVQDIDNPEDWEMAELKYNIFNKIK